MKIDAVLPAGGRIRGDFAREAGAEVKALIPIVGQTILERMLSALRATGVVERIVVVGPSEVAEHPSSAQADIVLPEGGDSGPANILAGLQWLHEQDGSHAERVLVTTTDLPFLTPASVTGFLDACPSNLDLCLPVMLREEFEASFPDMQATFVRLKDGEWTIGCAFLMNPEAIVRNRRMIERAFAARKSQIGMARLLGPLFILRFLTGRLKLSHIEERCLGILGCSGAGVNCAPELVLDIDGPEEYRYAVSHLCPASEESR